MQQCERNIGRGAVGQTEAFESLERPGGFAGFRASDSKARDAIRAGSRRGFGRLKEGALKRATQLIGERSVSAGESTGDRVTGNESLERDAIGVEAMVIEEPATR